MQTKPTITQLLATRPMLDLAQRIGGTEAYAVAAIVWHAERHGLRLRVHDGEEYAEQDGTEPVQAIAAVGHTEETVIHLEKDGVRAGWLRLIHGNGCDVLADYSTNGYGSVVGDPVSDAMTKLARAGGF
jgi:hypothetical protein